MQPPISPTTQLCAVIGDPVAHSMSPALDNAAFAARELDFVYTAFHLRDVPAALAGMRALGNFRGLSVTIPHKRAALAAVDTIDPVAERIGVINTVTNDNGVLRGMNTDGYGVLRAFEAAGVSLRGRRILLLGTGGAVRAAAFTLVDRAEPAGLTILGRTPEHVQTLVDAVQPVASMPVRGGHLVAEIGDAMGTHDVAIQGTPLGMAPERTGDSPVPAGLWRAEQVAFDMVYNPRETRLLREATAAGCITLPGLDMLLYQATLQFEAWTGVSAPVDIMRTALEAGLATRTT